MGEIKYTRNSNSAERICIPIVKSEGDGYDAINEYDNVALSVGMFNWNRDWLFNLLKKFKNISSSDFNNLISHYGLDVNTTTTQFIVDGTAHSTGNVEALRKLKFVYCFIMAAENINFQNAQVDLAKDWINRVRNTEVTLTIPATQPENLNSGTNSNSAADSTITKNVSDCITSEHGIALVVDLSVNIGLGNVASTVGNATNSVLEQSNQLSEWGNTEENNVIDAYISERHNLPHFTHAVIREDRINDANLSKQRNSYVQ